MSAGETEKYRKTCLKIYENQKIISRLLKWFLKNIKNETISMLSNEYDIKCLKKSFECVMLFYKYSIEPMQQTLVRINRKLEDAYIMEKKILEKIIPEICSAYTEFLNTVS